MAMGREAAEFVGRSAAEQPLIRRGVAGAKLPPRPPGPCMAHGRRQQQQT